MRLAAITCTNRRPEAFTRSTAYMLRQTRKPDLWIVAGTMHQDLKIDGKGYKIVMVKNEGAPGWANFVANMRCAMRHVPDDHAVAFFEDDDWYRPDHLAVVEDALTTNQAVGVEGMRYFHVVERAYLDYKSSIRPLAGTAFRGDAARKAMTKAIDTAQDLKTHAIDRFFWRIATLEGLATGRIVEPTVIGIKGQDGAKNLGIGRDPHGWTPDPDGEQLRRWIGDDADLYLQPSRT